MFAGAGIYDGVVLIMYTLIRSGGGLEYGECPRLYIAPDKRRNMIDIITAEPIIIHGVFHEYVVCILNKRRY